MTLWLRAFVLTQLIEAPIYWRHSSRPLRYALLPSAITHPVLWLTWDLWPVTLSLIGQIALAEALVTLVEALIWCRLEGRSLRWALGVATLANGLSVIGGELLRPWLG